MVDVFPFQGLRYQVPEASRVVAPPYDVISPSEQQALHARDPQNVVRLILGLKSPDDSETDNVYTRAHQQLEAWREAGILATDPAEAFYAYSQSWDGIERRGFIGRLLLAPYDSQQVLPHEYTLGGPKADRLALMKATGSVLSPIFCLYHDPEKQMEAALFGPDATPVDPIEVTDQDGVFHRFWPVSAPQTVKALKTLLADKKALIADGHHRYETAVTYRDWRREQDGQEAAPLGSLPYDYTMSFFTNMADPGLKIYPTHRVLTHLPEGWTFEKLLEAVNTYFEPVSEDRALFWIAQSGQPETAYALKPGQNLSHIPEPLRTLDVALLDQFIFQDSLKQSANDLKQQGYLQFVRDEDQVNTLLQSGALVFRVHAPSVESVRQICESGFRMPQKSTYFYPKLLSGLVFYYYGPATS